MPYFSSSLVSFKVRRRQVDRTGSQKGSGFQGYGLKYENIGASGLQDKHIGALGLHKISFGAPVFTVIKHSGFQAFKSLGLRALKKKFRGSRAPGTPPIGP